MKKISVILLILVSVISVKAQNVKAVAKLDSNKIVVGDQVRLKLMLTYPAKTTVSWPAYKDSLSGHIEIVNKSKIDTVSKDAKSLTLAQTYTITSFDSGGFYIPQISFRYKNPGDTAYFEALTDSLLLNVNVLPVDTTKAIKDIKGPMSVPRTLREMLPYIIGAILLAAIIWFVIFYLRKRKRGEKLLSFAKPKLPPHEEALLALDALRNKKLWQNNKIKDYYTELTEITRTYIQKRYGVLAMEMTTEEIMYSLKWFEISEKSKSRLREMLSLADLVKFAKAFPLPDEHDKCMDVAYNFVNETKLVEVAEPKKEDIISDNNVEADEK